MTDRPSFLHSRFKLIRTYKRIPKLPQAGMTRLCDILSSPTFTFQVRWTGTHAHAHHTFIHMRTFTHTHAHHMRAHITYIHANTHMRAYTYIHMHINVGVHRVGYVRTIACPRICACTITCMYTHENTHMLTHVMAQTHNCHTSHTSHARHSTDT